MHFLFADAVHIIPVSSIVWGICIGVNLAFIVSFIVRNHTGKIVRKLLSFPVGEEGSKTFSELGYEKVGFLHKVILKDGSTLRRIIFVEGGQIPKAENTEGVLVPDWENARFYIPEEQRARAESLYGKEQKWIFLPIFIIASVLLSSLMAWLMPLLLNAII